MGRKYSYPQAKEGSLEVFLQPLRSQNNKWGQATLVLYALPSYVGDNIFLLCMSLSCALAAEILGTEYHRF